MQQPVDQPVSFFQGSTLFNRRHNAKYMSEFVGTFFLAFVFEYIICLGDFSNLKSDVSLLKLVLGAVCIGSTVAVMVYQRAYLSGGNINPSVSLGICLRFGGQNKKQCFMYIFSQVAGGIFGAICSTIFLAKPTTSGYPQSTNVVKTFAPEFIFTSLLVSVYLMVLTDQRAKPNEYFGIAIGAVHIIAFIVIGPTTGGVLNPAVFIGTVFAGLVSKQKVKGKWWAYIAAHVLASLVSAMYYHIVYYDCDADPALVVDGTKFRVEAPGGYAKVAQKDADAVEENKPTKNPTEEPIAGGAHLYNNPIHHHYAQHYNNAMNARNFQYYRG